MPKTCARCGSLAGRGRELRVPGDWVSYLRAERDMAQPVGTLSMPLCTDCYPVVEDLREGSHDAGRPSTADRDALLDDLDLAALVDEGT